MTAPSPLRIAAWSGPRNISTAMMRAWENRSDCAVVDEPFYAHFLAHTGLEHPGGAEVIAAGEIDSRRVIAALTGPAPDGRAVFYQKHMTHHLLPHIDDAWFGQVTHAFLIRDPREVLLSYVRSRADVNAEAIGVPQQRRIFDRVAALTGRTPLVIDGGEFLKDPEGQLRAWCDALGIEFTPRMLNWPAGPRASDGAWAPHWYDAVLKSTGFEPWRPRDHAVPAEHRAIIDQCMPLYQALFALRLRT